MTTVWVIELWDGEKWLPCSESCEYFKSWAMDSIRDKWQINVPDGKFRVMEYARVEE